MRPDSQIQGWATGVTAKGSPLTMPTRGRVHQGHREELELPGFGSADSRLNVDRNSQKG